MGRTKDGMGVGPPGVAGAVAIGVGLVAAAADGLARPADGGTHAATSRAQATRVMGVRIRVVIPVNQTVVGRPR
jgi:hypothetical protein